MQTIPFKPQENFVLSDSEAELEASHPIKKRNLKKQSVLSDFPKQASKLMKSGDGEIAKLKKSIQVAEGRLSWDIRGKEEVTSFINTTSRHRTAGPTVTSF